MDNTKQRKTKVADGVTDAALIFSSFLLAFSIRFFLMEGTFSGEQHAAFGSQILFTAAYAVLLMAAYYFAGRYDYFRHIRLAKDIALVVLINTAGILAYMAFLYFTDMPDFSRIAIGIFYLLSTAFVIIKRAVALAVLRAWRRNGRNHKHVVIIGNGHLARTYVSAAHAEEDCGILIDGYVAGEAVPDLGEYLGSYSGLSDLLLEYTPDEMIIALEPEEISRMPEILTACEHSGVRTSIIPYYNDYLPNYPKIENLGKCKLINIRAIPLDNPVSAAVKRSFDVVVSGIALILLSPLMLFTAIGIKLTSPGPVLFRQERVGKDKKPFTMYKFRSMPVNVNHEGWTTAADSRRTKFGSFIRKFSIDELPQLWNVFVGDMSLVGPRPELPNYVRKFSEEIPLYLVRQQVRPGMTGLAQINGLRGDTSIELRVEYDITYIETWTWLLDLKILAKTALGGFINHQEVKGGSHGQHSGSGRHI